MTRPFVLPLSHSAEVPLVGGKAAALARLLAAGFPVPDGCCVTTHAYERTLDAIGFAPAERWRRALMRSGDGRRQELADCRERIRQSDLSGLLADLQEALQRIGGLAIRRWAVRSSATNEDMVHASGAGLYRTALGISWDGLAGGISDVWASLWNDRVMACLLQSGAAETPPAMAVVIQPLLEAAVAGVATSVDPVTGRDNHTVINAIGGLGSLLVDGTVMPDQYLVETAADQPARVIRRLFGRQHERLVLAGGGLLREPMAPDERKAPLLSDEQVFEVAALTKRIEEAFQGPVDVEWAMDRERLWALQARPLTAIRSPVTDEDSEWSRANFKETMPEVPSPMGLSFLKHFMDAYILSHYRRLGCRIPAGMSAVRIHAGRPYLNVTLFHGLVAQLGGDPALNAEQMGGDTIRSAPPVKRLGWPVLLRAAWLMWREMRRVLRDGPACFAEMKTLALQYSRERVQALSFSEAGARLDELGRWLETREMTFGIAAGTGQCLQVFSRLLPRWLGVDWRQLLNESLQGQDTVISAQQILRIADLARCAREDTAVSNALRRGWEPGRYRPSFEGSRFLSDFDRYLEDYGHRAVGESDIMSARLADQPEILLDVIRNQLDGLPVASDELLRRQRTTRDHALATIRARLGWRLDRWLLFQWWYRRLCRFFALREANRHHLMWYSLAVRALLLRVGECLVELDRLARREDIFFLTLREREALDDRPTEWIALIDARRTECEQWMRRRVPDVIRAWEDSPEAAIATPDAHGVLAGLPVSSGTVTGPVRFVRSTADWSRVRSGDILVAPVIDPGMAPLFGIAGGLIVEMGGTLSHGAIIAREYGLPAITNVVGAMSFLKEGEQVTMDAGQGVIRPSEPPRFPN
ncbi:MAG TPA: PEP/pyruvate-binding domain-containing protein [Nitrospira sp.]|nr:PEP/pyruvate-binding domain-containing protein [Nitrospira sp.]